MVRLWITRRCVRGGKRLEPGEVINLPNEEAEIYITRKLGVRYVPTVLTYRKEWFPIQKHQVENGVCINCGRRVGGRKMRRVTILRRFAFGERIYLEGDKVMMTDYKAELLAKQGFVVPERTQDLKPDHTKEPWTQVDGGWKCNHCNKILKSKSHFHLKTHEVSDGNDE